MSEWKAYLLGEISSKITKGTTPSTLGMPFRQSGINFIKAESVTIDGKIDSSKFTFIDELTHEKLKRSQLEVDDILFSMAGVVLGKTAIIEKIHLPANTNQALALIRLIKEIANPKFVKYYLSQRKIFEFINSSTAQSAQPNINLSEIADLKIILPPLPTQTAIAEILSSLDDKIELNNAINKNLEALAQALFKRWFVDFEFPCLPQNYRFSGHVNQASGITKPEDFDSVMTYSRVGGLPVPDGKSWFVYVLLCSDGSFYKGITNDLYRRFYEHYKGIGADWTKVNRPVKVIHWEAFTSKEDAAAREKELKTGYGRTWLEKQYAKINNGSPAPECELRMAGEMVESELGMIPKGWRVGQIGSLFDFVIGGDWGKEKPDKENTEIMFVIRGTDIPTLKAGDMEDIPYRAINKLKAKSRRLRPGDIIIEISGGSKDQPTGRTILITKEILDRLNGNAIPASFCRLIRPIESFSEYLAIYLNMLYNESGTWKYQNQSTGISNFQFKYFQENELLVLPSDLEILKQFRLLISKIFSLIMSNENIILKNLRNTLLPKLISGELEVNEALAQTETTPS